MFVTEQPVILASGSPRRQEYFAQAGIEYTVECADIDESLVEGESPEQYVRRMAAEKAAAVAGRHPDQWIVSGDTVVSFGMSILDKPVSTVQAVRQLMELSGKVHEVRTAYAIKNIERNIELLNVVLSEVKFWAFPVDIAMAYVNMGESFDKAGGYGIQGAGSLLVEEISGSYSNVVGFPMSQIVQDLQAFSIIKPAEAAAEQG